MTSPALNSTTFQIQRDSNAQEYVETCDEWVRATLVMFDGAPHIRLQEHHAAGSGRLHLGPLIPLNQWLAVKSAVDTLVSPYLRDPQKPLIRRTLSTRLEYAIFDYIGVMSQRRVQNTIGGWFNCIRDRVPELADQTDLLFALRRLCNKGFLRLKTLAGMDYSGNSADDSRFFGREFIVEATPEGWSYWESIKP